MTLKLKRPAQTSRRFQIATFFREHRIESGLSVESVSQALGLKTSETLLAYESGAEAIPLDEIFAMTNLLNIAPEDVLALIYDIHAQGADTL